MFKSLLYFFLSIEIVYYKNPSKAPKLMECTSPKTIITSPKTIITSPKTIITSPKTQPKLLNQR